MYNAIIFSAETDLENQDFTHDTSSWYRCTLIKFFLAVLCAAEHCAVLHRAKLYPRF